MTAPFKPLGGFELSLLPPALRGVPQIGVTFSVTRTDPMCFCGGQGDEQEDGRAFTKHGAPKQASD